MPNLSQRSQAMPASPIRKLVPFAEKAKSKGIKVYHLNIGQPDIETPEEMLNALKNMNMKVVEYSHSAGNESYRKKLVKYYADNGIHVDYTDIMITTGGSEALEFAIMCSLDDGDEIIIPEPFYANYNGMVIEAGAKVVSIRSTIDTGFALPPIEDFEKVFTKKTRAILICNPSNPTGYLYTKREIEQLRDLAIKHNIFIIVDEVYREFCYDGKTHHSIMEYDELKEHAILIDSISKRYSACGARIGTLVSRNKSFMDAALKLAQARLSPPSFGQIAAEAALEVKPEYFKKVKTEYTARRDFLVDALNKIDGVICPKPSGAFYCFVQLPVDDSDKFCQWILESFNFENQTVMMAPASGFYSHAEFGKNQVRIAYVLNIEELRNAVMCLEKALEAYPGKTKEQTKSGSVTA